MSSLYKISEDLLNLFSQIESQEGEVDEDQLQALAINEEELKQKLTNYHQAIQSWTADVKDCKDEEKRIATRRKIYENRINRLKSNMLTAVQTFGVEGKTNKFIELPTVRLYTRNSNAVQVSEARIQILIKALSELWNELIYHGALYTGEDTDLQGILDVINANIKAEYGDDFIPFTKKDLYSLKVTVSHTMSIADLFLSDDDAHIIKAYNKFPLKSEIIDATLKEEWKRNIELCGEQDEQITLAEIVTNQSIQIK